MLNSRFAELTGILLGDGSMNIYRWTDKNKEKARYLIKVTLDSRENSYASYVKTLIYDVFGKEPLFRKRKNENTLDLFLFGKEHLTRLISLGFIMSPKWNRAIIPSVFLVPALEKWVLRGYFDTDGSVVITNNNGTIYPRLEMKISPAPMQEQFICMLKRQGFEFGTYQIGKGIVRIQLNGRNQLQRWWDLIGFSNARHIDKARPFLFVESAHLIHATSSP